ncbi:hypothetical protein AIZ14_16310, partial [Salmonella enterica subsp. enterica serovar Typhimurium]
MENDKVKLGRNDKCWCKSGLKYKKCHLDRDREMPVSKAEALKFSKSKEGANKQVISSQADSLIKISRIWADF